MRRLLARLAALSVLGASISGCSGNGGTSLPYAGPPNNAGGNSGTYQSGATGIGLLRFVQGSPSYGNVDVCVDNLGLGITKASVAYGSASPLSSIPAGIGHTVSVYPPVAPGFGGPGVECATAPGPYFGTSAIATTVVTPAATVGAGARLTVVLGGTTGSTLGLYVFTEPSFAIAPTGPEAIAHNAAPVFSASSPNGVGFGYEATVGGTPAAIPGESSVAVGKKSAVTAATANPSIQASLPLQPAAFYDGAGVPSGTVTPIATVPVTYNAAQPFVFDLYAIDAAAGGLGLVAVQETSVGYGF